MYLPQYLSIYDKFSYKTRRQLCLYSRYLRSSPSTQGKVIIFSSVLEISDSAQLAVLLWGLQWGSTWWQRLMRQLNSSSPGAKKKKKMENQKGQVLSPVWRPCHNFLPKALAGATVFLHHHRLGNKTSQTFEGHLAQNQDIQRLR